MNQKNVSYCDIMTPEMQAYYQENICDFVEDIIFHENSKDNDGELFLSDQQREILISIQDNRRVAVKSGRGIGKCLEENEELLLADGSYATAKDLVGKQFKVHSFDENGNHKICEANAFDNGEKPVYFIKTKYGHELYRTDNHPLLTYSGWKQMDELKVGDKLAFPTKINHIGTKTEEDDIFKLFGYVIGDGSIKKGGISFSQEDNPQLKEFRAILDKYDTDLIKINDFDYRVSSRIKKKNKSKINAIFRRLYKLNTNSWKKTIPEFVFTSPNEQTAIFLSRLFSCDGWASVINKDSIEIGYCTVSKQLGVGIQRLLKRFGIVAKLRKKKTSFTYKGQKKYSFAYCLEIHDADNALKFIENIGIYGKEKQLDAVKKIAVARNKNTKTGLVRKQYDIYPKECLEEVVDYIGYKKARYELNLRKSNQTGKTKNKLLSMDDIPKRARFFLNLEAGFDEIEEIVFLGTSKTVGVTVPETHVYTNDVFEHNTATIAFACIWWLSVHSDECKFVCTAPSYSTLKTGLWNEICMWFSKSLVKDVFEVGSERIYLRENKTGCFAEPRTAREKEAMSGIHAKNLLIICDEASGTDDDIIRTLDATLTSGADNKICLITNPTRTTGFLYETYNADKKRWVGLTYSSEFSPFVDPEHVESYERKFGRSHPLFLVDVLGEFPPQDIESFLALTDVKAAVNRTVAGEGAVELGVDVARFGDDSTVVYWRHGYKVYPCKKLPKSTVPQVSTLVLNVVKEARAISGYEGKIRVKVDDTGVGGGVVDILNTDRENNIEVIPCNFGGAGNDIYQNEASIMWGEVKNALPFIDLPDENNMVQELAARRYKLSDKGRIVIEPKREYKKTFGNSPDFADAIVLLFAGKVSDRTVLKNFDPQDTCVVKSSVAYLGDDKFCSIYFSRDLLASILYMSWDGYKITVTDEYVGDDALIYLAMQIREKGPFSRIIGSNKMFGGKTDDLASKFRKFKVNIYENYKYDELGAIEMLDVITTQRRLQIFDGCKRTINQLHSWKISGSKVSQENDFGLCYALANIVSFLKKKFEVKKIDTSFRPYSTDRLDSVQLIKSGSYSNKNSWMSV